MRKLKWMLGSLMLMLGLLTGCGGADDVPQAPEENEESANPTEQAEETVTITLSEDEGEEVFEEKTVEIEDGAIVMDVMKENFDVEEEGGFIDSIDGIAPEEGEEKSWMYFVNDEMAMVGAEEYELEAGDEVVFDLQEWE